MPPKDSLDKVTKDTFIQRTMHSFGELPDRDAYIAIAPLHADPNGGGRRYHFEPLELTNRTNLYGYAHAIGNQLQQLETRLKSRSLDD